MPLTFADFTADLGRVLGANLTANQVLSVRMILRQAEKWQATEAETLSYILATAWHESRLLPIREKRAAAGSSVAAVKQLRTMQNRYWPSGYYGRGLVQLTWKKNYELWGKLLGLDLVRKPDLALDVEVAAEILVRGMVEGRFTGKALREFFYPDCRTADWLGARLVVNGKVGRAVFAFHADVVAGWALKVLTVVQKYYPGGSA